MSGTVLFLLALVAPPALGTGLGLLEKHGAGQGAEHWPLLPPRVLTAVEQQLHQRLLRAFPDHATFAQVPFSQILGATKGLNFKAIWHRYHRLTADFVLCHRDFSIAAVIELDDRPNRTTADRRKAAICAAMGIPLHRLTVNPLPSESELREWLQRAQASYRHHR